MYDFVRESRLRNYLGVRYDSRSGAYDWDYHMKLQEVVSVSAVLRLPIMVWNMSVEVILL